MKDISDDTITGLLMGDLEKIIEYFYADEIELVTNTGEEGAPGLDEIIDQISAGMVGYGGQEIVGYKTELEQARQGVRRAEKFIEFMSAEVKRWVKEHADFLTGLITGELAESGLAADVDRIRKLAELLEKKQDAFPPYLVAIYALGPGWDVVFSKQ